MSDTRSASCTPETPDRRDAADHGPDVTGRGMATEPVHPRCGDCGYVGNRAFYLDDSGVLRDALAPSLTFDPGACVVQTCAHRDEADAFSVDAVRQYEGVWGDDHYDASDVPGIPVVSDRPEVTEHDLAKLRDCEDSEAVLYLAGTPDDWSLAVGNAETPSDRVIFSRAELVEREWSWSVWGLVSITREPDMYNRVARVSRPLEAAHARRQGARYAVALAGMPQRAPGRAGGPAAWRGAARRMDKPDIWARSRRSHPLPASPSNLVVETDTSEISICEVAGRTPSTGGP